MTVVALDQGRPIADVPWYSQTVATYRIGLRSLRCLEKRTSQLSGVNFNSELRSRLVWEGAPSFTVVPPQK